EVITSSDKRYINRIFLVKTMKLLPSDIFHYNKKSFIVNKARIKRFALNFKYAYVSIEDMEISIPVDSDSDFVKKFKDDYLDI
ncbi:MAG: hypothetical protein ACPG5P_09455, partial [Saprospiraceae bacterium]